MKSTESLDDAGKSVDLASATGETTLPSETSSPENNRRRLVRGAVAFAPLVLTLRSGALAAASCTAAEVPKAAVNGNGRIFLVPPSSRPPDGVEGDYCVKNVGVCSTNSGRISTGEVDPLPITKKIVDQEERYFCGTFRANGSGQQNRIPIAILSSGSVTSLRG